MFKNKFRKSGAAIFICLILLMVTALGGCGSDSAKSEISQDGDYMAGSGGSFEGGFDVNENVMPENIEIERKDSAAAPFLRKENVKLIYSAYVTLQTVDFEKAEIQFMDLVEANEGYLESSYVDRGSYYSSNNRIYASYTVRVPQKNYETFLASVGETSHVVNINKDVQDIGMEYFDTETRLKTLQSKFDRLTELFQTATQMSDIITLENALADTQYQIDTYTSTLNRYDSLIGYSTINVSIEQVERLDSGIDEDEGFFASLMRNFVNGFNHFVDSVENLFMWVAYNILAIALAIGLLILIRKWYIKRVKEKGSLFSGAHIKKIADKIRRTDKKE